MAHIGVRIPDEWLGAIDQARGDAARSAWVRSVVLRSLRASGHTGLRQPNPVSERVLAARLRRAKRAKAKKRLRDQIRTRRRPGGAKRARESRERRLAEMRRLEFVVVDGRAIVRRERDGTLLGYLLSSGEYESDVTTWGNTDEVWRQCRARVKEGVELPAAWEQWRQGQAAWRRARAERRHPKK